MTKKMGSASAELNQKRENTRTENSAPLEHAREHRKAVVRHLHERNRQLADGAEKLMANAGSVVEHSLSAIVEQRGEPPIPEDQALVSHVWYRIPLPDGISGDGSEFHCYLKKGAGDHLVIFLSGGGVAWNEYTAARPVTGSRMAAGEPNFYWNNLRPITQLMNINVGITEADSARNPFRDWNFLVIPYTTGDFHVGNRDVPYLDEEGKPQILHCHGAANVQAALRVGKAYFPNPDKLLIAGDSAGGFAVPACSETIVDDWYPSVTDITLFSDSAQLLCRSWQTIARDFWGAAPAVWEPLETPNITYDWYRHLLQGHPGKFRILYATSTHDYLLSAYYNDMTTKVYQTNAGVRSAFYRQTKNMVHWLRELTPDSAFFINNWVNPLFTKAQMGTVHTAVRQPYFYVPVRGGVTMASWLSDAVNGTLCDVGTELLGKML